jgi:hypothetical protein
MRQHCTLLARRACERSVHGLGPGVAFLGLQFAEQTWLANRGGRYASSANLATPAQHIAVAQNVLASKGIGAWPVCGARGYTSPGRHLSAPACPSAGQAGGAVPVNRPTSHSRPGLREHVAAGARSGRSWMPPPGRPLASRRAGNACSPAVQHARPGRPAALGTPGSRARGRPGRKMKTEILCRA